MDSDTVTGQSNDADARPLELKVMRFTARTWDVAAFGFGSPRILFQ
jgi:hypothetical protein